MKSAEDFFGVAAWNLACDYLQASQTCRKSTQPPKCRARHDLCRVSRRSFISDNPQACAEACTCGVGSGKSPGRVSCPASRFSWKHFAISGQTRMVIWTKP